MKFNLIFFQKILLIPFLKKKTCNNIILDRTESIQTDQPNY
jgi:hypothetical protein